MEPPIKILVIDEDAVTRRLLEVALTSEGGNQVTAMGDLNEALARLNTTPDFALIIGDLMTHAPSGLRLIEVIRSINHTIPLLVLSSVQTNEMVAKALELGADDYLQKPVDLRELRRSAAVLINRYLGKGSSAGAKAVIVPPPQSPPRQRPSVRTVADGTFVELMGPTDPVQAERFQRFAERLLATSLTEKERHNLHLALEEIVRNAIEWGNRNDCSKNLRLSYCLLPDRITFRIEDEGQGFDHAGLKDPSVDPQAHIRERRASGKRMGGWGVFLTRKVMDEVVYNTKGNVVFLTKYLHRPTSESSRLAAPQASAETKPAADVKPAASPALPRRALGDEPTRLQPRNKLPQSESETSPKQD